VILDAAKAVPIESEIARRGIRLIKRHNEYVGPCVVCGGRDRFSINSKKRVWHCRGCAKGGDVIALVEHIDGVDFRTAVRTLDGSAEVVSSALESKKDHRPINLVNQDAIDGQNTERALKLWNDAAPIDGTIAERYLHSRKLHDLPGDDVLRFHASCPFGKSRSDCLLALYTGIEDNKPKAIARTAINISGHKIGRLSLGPTKGAAVKLDADENVEFGLHVAEGVETALAARMRGYRPCWALGSAGALRSFPLLGGVECLTLMVDNDHPDQRGRQAGQEAATECWRRWKAAGREVLAFSTNKPGTDIADINGEDRHNG
jgi:phage/plasmid primase-like uncharacterized protein